MSKISITILTPTYNRVKTLSRLYDSLCGQTVYDFEWIVVDDGSDDSTRLLIDGFLKDCLVDIKYIYQENAGKHIAVNTGVAAAKGEWVFIVDSDDCLTFDAVESIVNNVKDAGSLQVGVCYRKALLDGSIVGVVLDLDVDFLKLNPTEAGNLFKGDLAYVFKRNAMLKNPFPFVSGEKFVPELYIWNKISDLGFIVFYINKYIYMADYMDDGYTKNFKINLKRNPNGFLIYYKSQISREKIFIRKAKCLVRVLQCYFYNKI